MSRGAIAKRMRMKANIHLVDDLQKSLKTMCIDESSPTGISVLGVPVKVTYECAAVVLVLHVIVQQSNGRICVPVSNLAVALLFVGLVAMGGETRNFSTFTKTFSAIRALQSTQQITPRQRESCNDLRVIPKPAGRVVNNLRIIRCRTFWKDQESLRVYRALEHRLRPENYRSLYG